MIASIATIRIAVSFRKEIVIVMLVLGILLGMPIAAVMAKTKPGELQNDSGATLYTGTSSTANTYDYGYCTFWAAQRRIEVGLSIPNNWGDAHTWDDRSVLAGYAVDHTPSKYAIMETDRGALGHVAFVEDVALDGSWTISEMNAKGWDVLDTRTLTVTQAQDYNFIH
jgi:surface antigen